MKVNSRILGVTIGLITAVVLAGCSASKDSSSSASSAPTASATATATATATAAAKLTQIAGIVNVWKNPGSVVATALPLGDGNTSTTTSAAGSVFACRAGDAAVGGSQVTGPWITGKTWNSTTKLAVQGSKSWPEATFSTSVSGSARKFTTKNLPVGGLTGTFPIAKTDPAYTYDGNPNTIGSTNAKTISITTTPTVAATPNCLTNGAIGIMLNGVVFFNALDGPGRDAAANEVQDLCQGHPESHGQYHYHDVSTCVSSKVTSNSDIIGWAYDGYPLVVERDAAGNLPNNADLDVCHGRTSPIMVDGKLVTQYHYSATLEYPYTLGCYRGVSTQR